MRRINNFLLSSEILKKIKELQQFVKKNYLKSSTLIYKDDPKENYLIVCKNQTCSNKIKNIEELKICCKKIMQYSDQKKGMLLAFTAIAFITPGFFVYSIG